MAMVEFELKITDMVIVEWLKDIQANLHEDEVFRFEFSGMAAVDERYTTIYMHLPEGLKLRSDSKLKSWDLYKYDFDKLKVLPYWRELHKDKKCISVKFEAKVVRFEEDVLTLLLPDSYEEKITEEPKTVIYLPDGYNKPLDSFVSIDFETVNAVAVDGKKYSYLPVSIGMVKVCNGDIVQEFYSLIKPPSVGEWLGMVKPRIEPIDCIYAPDYKEVFPLIIQFVGKYQPVSFSCGIAKNVFMNMEKLYEINHSFTHGKSKKKWLHKEEFIDPLRILRAFGEKGNSLVKACERRDIYTFGSHNALDDANAIAKLLLELNNEKKKFAIEYCR